MICVQWWYLFFLVLLQLMGNQVSGDLNRHAQNSIDTNEKLTQNQKDSMTDLRKSTTHNLELLQQRSLKLREVLIKDFESGDTREISLIREHLQNVNNLQVVLIFDTLKKANEIVGRNSSFRDTVIELLNRQPNVYLP